MSRNPEKFRPHPERRHPYGSAILPSSDKIPSVTPEKTSPQTIESALGLRHRIGESARNLLNRAREYAASKGYVQTSTQEIIAAILEEPETIGNIGLPQEEVTRLKREFDREELPTQAKIAPINADISHHDLSQDLRRALIQADTAVATTGNQKGRITRTIEDHLLLISIVSTATAGGIFLYRMGVRDKIEKALRERIDSQKKRRKR